MLGSYLKRRNNAIKLYEDRGSNQEVLGLSPAGCWAIFLSIDSKFPNQSGPLRGRISNCVMLEQYKMDAYLSSSAA